MKTFYTKKYAKQGRQLPCFCFRSVDSTNTVARAFVAERSRGVFAVISREQTAGRGRYGRKFLSLADRGTFVTYVRPVGKDTDAAPLGALCALAVRQTLAEFFGIDALLKWPNDVLADGRKICGILPECVFGKDGVRFVFLGIGINLFYTEEELGDLHDIATSATLLCADEDLKCRYCKNRAKTLIDFGIRVAQLCDELCEQYESSPEELWERYSASLVTLGKTVSFTAEDGTRRVGKAVAVRNDGALATECVDGVHFVRWGEVTQCFPEDSESGAE